MAFLLQNLFFLLLLLVLLAISGTFSGAESVLFSLSRTERLRMKKSRNRLEVLAATLLDDPRSLLTSLLMGNMTCNIIVFVVSSLLLTRLCEKLQAAAAGGSNYSGKILVGALTVVPPLMVTYVADVFPKVIGSLNNTRIAPLIALPVTTLVRLLWPVSRFVDVAIMRPLHRLVGPRQDQASFSNDELQDLLETSQQQGVIDVSENELLQEVVRIADLKVRDVMTPRVDVVAFNIQDPPEKLIALFRQTHLAKMPVYDGQIDNLLGLIYAKTVLLDAPTPADLRRNDIRKMLQGVRYVPEQQSLDRLLLHFRQTKTQLAIVVDEFGGVVGVVALEDVVEQMVGDIHEPHDAPARAVQRIAANEYLVPGDLSVSDWMDAFGAKFEITHTTTVAGLFAAMLQRIPKQGDEIRLEHLLMRVESMRGRRVDKVRLKLVDKAVPETGGGAA